jgi:Flp pilus assembly protein TadG
VREVAPRLSRDCAGAAALEFALVAPLALALIVATVQLALVFLGQQGLESAAERAARMIQSGQAQQAGWSAAQFRKSACGGLPPFLACGRLSVAVTSGPVTGVSGFAEAGAPAAGSFAPGGPDDVVVMRLSYLWPTSTAPLGFDLSNQPGGGRMLLATQVFRNEAYAAVGP